MSGLPIGWDTMPLGEVLILRYGKGLPERTRSTGDVPVFGSNGRVGSHSISLIKGPSIIVGRKGSVGEVHFCDGPCWPIDTTYFINDFRDHSPEFWFLYLKTLGLTELNRSTAIPGLNRDDAYKLSVNVPPPKEQQRIVSSLKSFLLRTDKAKKELNRIAQLAERYRLAVLEWSYWGGQKSSGSLPKDWKWVPVRDLCEMIVDCPHTTPRWTEVGEICVRTTQFKPGKLDLSTPRYVSIETYNERIARLRPEPNDVLYSREGGILGVACQIPPRVRLCLGQRMMLMRTRELDLSSCFVDALSEFTANNGTSQSSYWRKRVSSFECRGY